MRIKLIAVFFIVIVMTAEAQVGNPDSTMGKFKTAVTATDTVVYDTLKPINVSAGYNILGQSYRIAKNALDFTDYIYAGNWIGLFPFGYLQNGGVLGLPNEISLYANGNGENAIMIDGIDIGDRTGAAIDLYELRSEIMDTAEYLKPGFSTIGSSLNNSTGINFITKDKIAIVPLTRIRYYQAPNEEGYIDGQFNLYPAKRLNISGGLTNSSVNSDYTNSEYGNWKASIKARYLMSNRINFVLDYYYANINGELNGGVNYNKILSSNSSARANEILYSSIEAPVLFGDRYQKITNNRVVLKTLLNLFKAKPIVFSLYYFSNLKEFRQNELKSSDEYAYVFHNNRTKTYGGKLSHSFNMLGINWTAEGAYEKIDYNLHMINALGDFTNKWISVSAFKDYSNFFRQIVFAKYGYYMNEQNISLGTDFNLALSDGLVLSGGYSIAKKPLSLIHSVYLTEREIDESNFNFSLKYKTNNGLISLSYFNRANSNEVWNILADDSLTSASVGGAKYVSANTVGTNLFASLEVFNILFEFNGSYYFQNNDYDVYKVPEWTLRSGLYYVDTLFNRNLKMKFGFNFYAQGKQSYRIYDFEKMLTSYLAYDGVGNVYSFGKNTNPSYQVDLFFAGKIRDKAIAYFVLENITDNKYFIVPYYPMKGITFRFGVAWELYN